MKQQTSAMGAGFEQYQRQTRRAKFLAAMELVAPRAEVVALSEPQYRKAIGQYGGVRGVDAADLSSVKAGHKMELRPGLERGAQSVRSGVESPLPTTKRMHRAAGHQKALAVDDDRALIEGDAACTVAVCGSLRKCAMPRTVQRSCLPEETLIYACRFAFFLYGAV